MSDKRATYRKNHADEIKVKQRTWRKNNPHKRRAHGILQRAVLKGCIRRPESCEECGKTTKLHAHHHDYSKPLSVVWLCPRCHRAEHGGFPQVANKRFAYGENHGRCKLSVKQVRDIKKRIGKESKRGIAREYGVHESLIRLIEKGDIWKNV